jgi:ABC-type nitrate/sulfonate/bicarbonate transport system substrate-binding protein
MQDENPLPVNHQRRVLLCGSAAAAAGALLPGRQAQAQTLQKVTLAYPTRSGASWPMFMAKEAGYYAKYGLDVDLVFGIHPAGIAMLTSGEAQMANYGIDPVMNAATKDSTFVAMGSSLNKGSFGFISRKGIKRGQDLKGMKIGVGRVGDTPYHYTVSMLKKWNIGPRDVTWVPSGADAAGRVATLAAGQVDAALLTTPSFFRLIDDGAFNNLAYISEFPDIFVSTVYLFRKSYVAQNPTVAENLIKAHAEAIKRFYDDKITAIKAYSSNIRGETPVDTARVYDLYRKDNLLDRIPFVLKGAISSGIERDGDANPQLKTFDFNKLVDNSVVLRLVREGWFEKLYGPSVKAEQDRKLKEAFGV